MKEKIHWKSPFDYETLLDLEKTSKEGIGWHKVIHELWDASEEIIRSEIAHRSMQKAKYFNFKEKEEQYDKRERMHHSLSIGHLRQTLRQLEGAEEKYDAKKKGELDTITKETEGLNRLKTEALNFIKEDLIEVDIDPEVSTEIIEIYEEIVGVVETEGYEGLVKNLKNNINELIEKRSDESRNRWREEKHSPLAWWKWLIIAGVAGAAVGTLIGCLLWFGCSWIYKIALASSAVVRAIVATGC